MATAKVASSPAPLTKDRRLNLKDLKSDLHRVTSKWRELGIQLDIDTADLDIIEADGSRAGACLRQVIDYLLNKTDLSDEERKEKLIDAMKSASVGEIRRGSELERELQPPLTPKNLTDALDGVAASWHPLGIQLDIPSGELNKFETYSRNVERYFSDMLALWLRQGPKIENLVTALRKIQERRLAGELEKKYEGYNVIYCEE